MVKQVNARGGFSVIGWLITVSVIGDGGGAGLFWGVERVNDRPEACRSELDIGENIFYRFQATRSCLNSSRTNL